MTEKNRQRMARALFALCLIFAIDQNSIIKAQIVEWDDCERFLGNVSYGSTPSSWLEYWNQVTPENGGKWGSVERTRDVMDWADLDIAYALAKDNDLLFKQHVFVWGNQQPSWIEDLSEAEQLEEIEEWIMEMCTRYPETDMIEVVNEPVNDPPDEAGNGGGNYMEALGGRGVTGYDWIITAFELAKEHCPNAALIINEYNVLNVTGVRNNYLNIIDLLIERDLLDAIGVQAHEFSVFPMQADAITSSLDDLAEKDLPIYVTELDIGSGDNNQPIDDQVQLEAYQRIFPALWNHRAVYGVTLWGYQPGMWRSTAYLENADGSDRPAFEWMKNYISRNNSKCDGVTSAYSELEKPYQFSFYPNPVTDKTITLSSKEFITTITIRNIGGKIIQRIFPDINRQSLTINLDANSGVYLIEVKGRNYTEVQRIVIK
ncbi:MAG: endo-1,4-beta-xylanase [Reichenbachiella sp.]